MKFAVYTCNMGKYDLPISLISKDPLVDYIYFTDAPSAPGGWQHKKIFVEESECLTARKVKIMSNVYMADYDMTIWIDACFAPKMRNVRAWAFESLKNNLIACYRHTLGSLGEGRTCIYQEAEECKLLKLDDQRIIDLQMISYKKQGFPKNFGLFSTGVIVRMNHPRVKEFELEWWKQVSKFSKRDQLSQMYALWKTNLKISQIFNGGLNIYTTTKFDKMKHLKRRKKMKK